MPELKYCYDSLKKFCKENGIELYKDYSQEVVRRETKIEGKCLTKDCTYLFNKSFRAIENGALCKECSIKSGTIKTRHFLHLFTFQPPFVNNIILLFLSIQCFLLVQFCKYIHL